MALMIIPDPPPFGLNATSIVPVALTVFGCFIGAGIGVFAALTCAIVDELLADFLFAPVSVVAPPQPQTDSNSVRIAAKTTNRTQTFLFTKIPLMVQTKSLQ
jgi:hypothetical protein